MERLSSHADVAADVASMLACSRVEGSMAYPTSKGPIRGGMGVMACD